MSEYTHSTVKFYRGKRVFLTGHTGFVGSWLAIWLNLLGSRVYGFALEPPTSPSLFESVQLSHTMATSWIGDICDYATLVRSLRQAQPDLVFHLAAQPLVRQSYRAPRETFDTNLMGTVNILDALREVESVRACIIVTSDKCYRNREWNLAYREDDELGGSDPYSASKAAAELITDAYRKSFFSSASTLRRVLGLGSVRAGNVIGGGDWAQDRIMPDSIRALADGEPIRVRSPQAMRPWQHVLEPLSGYLWLATRLWHNPERYSEAWNFGPVSDDWHSVRDLVGMVVSEWGIGAWVDASDPNAPHEAGLLRLNIDKAQARLGWLPVWRLQTAVQQTVDWYKRFYAASSSGQLLRACAATIEAYAAEAHARGLEWAH